MKKETEQGKDGKEREERAARESKKDGVVDNKACLIQRAIYHTRLVIPRVNSLARDIPSTLIMSLACLLLDYNCLFYAAAYLKALGLVNYCLGDGLSRKPPHSAPLLAENSKYR